MALALVGCATPASSARVASSPRATASPLGGPLWTTVAQPVAVMSAAEREIVDDIATAALRDHGDGATALYLGTWDPVRGVYLAAYGQAAPGRGATVADHNRIASITKTFTATAVLDLVADGRISLDDSLATVIPDIVAVHQQLGTVTIDELLGMRSGIGDIFCCADAFAADFFRDPQRTITLDELIADGLLAGSPTDEGLTVPEYSNTNYVILGAVLEAVTGRPAEDVVTDTARAAGLEETALADPDVRAMPDPAAQGYLGPNQVAEHADRMPPDLVAGTDTSDWSMSFARAAGGMYSTVGDLGAWAATGFGSTLLPASLAELRLTPPAGGSYGYGIMRSGDWIGHGGSVHGWISMTAFDMKTATTFVAIVNSGGGEGALEPLAKYLLPNAPFTQ